MRRRRRAAIAAALCAALLAGGLAATADGVTSTLPPGLEFDLGGIVSPRALPKHEFVPVKVGLEGRVATSDSTQPSALRELELDIDKDVAIDVRGLAVCRPPGLTVFPAVPLRRLCRSAAVGRGTIYTLIAFPDSTPVVLRSPVTIYNRGESDGKVNLLLHGLITVPVPASLNIEATMERVGVVLRVVTRVPVIAGGYGSLLDFKLKIGRKYTFRHEQRSFLTAKCPDGQFKADVSALFRNEAHTPGVAPTTKLSESLAIPCIMMQ